MKIKLFFGFLLFLVFILWSCEDKREALYERPDWLAKPIFQTLENEGRFTLFTGLVKKSQYFDALSSSGLYTIFAPNDTAVRDFMAENGYSTIEDIPQIIVDKIVSYTIVYNYYDSVHFGSVLNQNRWTQFIGYKYETACYDFLRKEEIEGKKEWVLNYRYYFSIEDLVQFNNKFLPFFTNGYFSRYGLVSSDYTQFFPQSIFTGKNVLGSDIINFDIYASNGVIHEVDKVNTPPQNFEEKLMSDVNYSKFRSFLDFQDITGAFYYKNYTEEKELAVRFAKIYPDSGITKLFSKDYNALINFSPSSEMFNGSSYESQSNGYTVFAPSNTAVDEFMQKKLLKYYTKLSDVPKDAITAFINSHVCEGLIWPSTYKTTKNSLEEFINGKGTYGPSFNDAETKITESKILSNGMFYGLNRVIKNKLFETVYSEIFLNPDHYMLDRAFVKFYNLSLREELMWSELSGYTSERYTLFLPSDKLLGTGVGGDGFTYNIATNTFSNSNYSGNDEDRLKRLMRQLILKGYKNSQLDIQFTDFTGNKTVPIFYGGWKYVVNDAGELIRYKDYQVQAIGNVEDNTFPNITIVDTLNNGVVYSIDKLLQFTPRETKSGQTEGWEDKSLWYYLNKARSENPDVKVFVDFVDSCLRTSKVTDPNYLTGISATTFYTVLMPTNNQMRAARIALGFGGTDAVPTADLTPDKVDILAKATKFIYSHILVDRVVADDYLPVMYPVNTASPNEILLSTLNKVTNLSLDLNNAKTFVRISKDANKRLVFAPQDVVRGDGKLLVKGEKVGSTVGVTTGVIAGAIPNNHRSNRMARKAVLHQINWYMKFTEQQP